MCFSVSRGYNFSKTVSFCFEQNSVLACSYTRKSSMFIPGLELPKYNACKMQSLRPNVQEGLQINVSFLLNYSTCLWSYLCPIVSLA